MVEPIHYVPVSEQRYARILETLEQAPDPQDWNHLRVCALADTLDALANSTDQLGPDDTPIVMDVNLLRTQADDLRHRDTINPPQLAARLASYVRREG